jgi:hypothetical protein
MIWSCDACNQQSPGQKYSLGWLTLFLLHAEQKLTGWRVFTLPLDSVDGIRLSHASASSPPSPVAAQAPVSSFQESDASAKTFAAHLQEAVTSLAASASGACPNAPSSVGQIKAPAPLTDGPTFYRYAHLCQHFAARAIQSNPLLD